MKWTAFVALVLLVLSPQTPQPQQAALPKGSIEGLVLQVGTNEPVKGARVTLTRVQGPATAAPSPAVAPQINPAVITDPQGKFVFSDVDAGQYRIPVASNGYARTEYGQRIFGAQGTTITLVAGQIMKDLVVHLTPGGNINGRVQDSMGQPIVGVPVQLLKASYNSSGQRTFQSAGSTRTNDRGEYRLYWVTPGRYFLNAGSSQGTPVNVGGGGASPNEVQDAYVSTYYPNVTDIGFATILDIRPGSEMGGIDVSISRQQLYRIRGRVFDTRTERPPAAVTLTISSRSLTGGGFTLIGGANQKYNSADGSFELRDMAPGPYVIGAQITETSGILTSSSLSQPNQPRAQAPVVVAGADVENLAITILSPMSLPGRLSIDGQSLETLTALDRIRVQLLPPTDANSLSIGAQSQSQPVHIDGAFTVDNLVPGDYRVSVSGMPPGLYLKAARLDQSDGVDQLLHVSASSTGTLDVVLSPNGGQIDGTLVDEKQQPVRGTQVVLVPDQQRTRIDLYKTTTSDQTGHFTIRAIPPGNYKLFAWEAIEQFGYYDADLMRSFESKGKLVRVAESSTQAAEVRIIPPTEP